MGHNEISHMHKIKSMLKGLERELQLSPYWKDLHIWLICFDYPIYEKQVLSFPV